jgi:ferredoxin
MGAELAVDATRCMGHGRCYSVAPNLLSDDEEGFVTLRGSSMPIEDTQIAEAEEAVAACPEQAITLSGSS